VIKINTGLIENCSNNYIHENYKDKWILKIHKTKTNHGINMLKYNFWHKTWKSRHGHEVCKTKIETKIWCNDIQKCEHEMKWIRWWFKIIFQNGVEHVQHMGGGGLTFIYIALGTYFEKFPWRFSYVHPLRIFFENIFNNILTINKLRMNKELINN